MADLLSQYARMPGFKSGLQQGQRTGEADLLLSELRAEYPHLKKYGVRVDDKRGKMTSRGHSEYFSADEPTNPYPGERTVQLYSPEFKGKRLKNLLFGEHFHVLGQEDHAWREKKQRFYQLLPPEDKALLSRKYEKLVQSGQENRPFDKWLDVSELDQWMGALVNPPNEEWRNVRWSPEHKALREEMLEYLRNGR